MNTTKTRTSLQTRTVGAAIFAVVIFSVGAARIQLSKSSATKSREKTVTTQSKFYCNIKALGYAERIKHMLLTGKLIMVRKEIVETENGYEFQFSRSNVSVEDLANWVVAESKCCPFFDFHIDLEEEGRLLCLRLTGEAGVKEFIRSEFKVTAT